MEKLVRKRDGNIVSYNRDKIEIAIQKAGKASDSLEVLEASKELAKNVEFILEKEFFRRDSIPSVEEIQDAVEKILIRHGFVETAKAYILYREKRREARELDLTKESALLLVDEYLEKADWRVNENSNMTYSLQGLNFNVSGSLVARYWLSKIYPEEIRIANDSGLLHIHDLGVLGPYTYFGKEVIVAKIDGRIKLISFEKLYDCTNAKEEILDIKEEATVKFSKDLFVLDKDGWTEVKRVVKKKKNRPMHFIKNRGGRSVIVTDNHPMITEDCGKEAKNVTTGIDKTFTVDIGRLLPEEELFKTMEIDLLKELMNKDTIEAYFNGIPIDNVSPFNNSDGIIHTQSFSSRRKIKLTQKFGYFAGFALAEGYLSYDEDNSRTVTISQKFKEPLLKANEGLIENGMSGCLRKSSEKYELRVRNPFLRLLFEKIFKIEPGSRNKTLPEEILYYNKDFVMGLLAGLTDGDGSIATCNTVVNIRIAGRTLLEQSAVVLSLLGFTPRDRCIEGQNAIHNFNGKLIIQNYPLYGVSFRKIGKDIPSEKYNRASISVCAWHDESKDEWHKVINNEPADIPDNYIYDITTESGTLVVNGMWNHNCVGWSLEDLLQRGFGGVRGKVESAPPKHFRTALGQVVNFFYTLQGEAAGAQAFSNFDTLLAPYVRFDKLSYSEIKQAMQEFIFNLNVPTRVGFQTPFTNLTLDIIPPNNFKNKSIVYAGKKLDATYGEFTEEMSMINQAFAELMIEGDRKGRIFTFPIPTYNITHDFDWERDDLQKIWEMTAKYGVPYFANFVNSDMSPEDAQSMCCRLRLDKRELRKRGGGLFGADPLTGSVGVVTINIPRIAYVSRNDEEFFSNLRNAMELAKTSLEIKRKVIENFTERGLYPYSRYYLNNVKRDFGRYWANHFSTIGLIGMNEATLNFLGKPISDLEARKWVINVITFMRDGIRDFQEATGNFYNLEATPAEGASYRLAKKDREQFGDRIITAGDIEVPYYTNSVHLPVTEEHDIFEVLEHQDDLQTLFTGGTVVHLFLGEAIHDWHMCREVVRKIVSSYKLPYFTLTPTFSICPVHGYLEGEHNFCPRPHTETELANHGIKLEEGGEVIIKPEIYSRIVGYFRPVENWNRGKKKEFSQRATLRVVA